MRYEYEEVAEIKSSLLGSKFTLLDNDTKASLVTICHQREFLGLWGARQMDVYFPKDIIMESCLKECYESEKYLGKIEKYSCEFAL